jgi:catechol 2,3-dioxygenase-like lactoylglutathione lyase family enzyme
MNAENVFLKLSVTLALFLLHPQANAQLAVPNEAGLAFGHVNVNVSDPGLHTRLWVEHFDGVVTRKGDLTAVRFPGFLVSLTEALPSGGSQGSVMNHFGFKVRNLAKFLAGWRAAGYSVDREFTGAEGQPNAYVTMPDGVWVELQEDQMLPVEIAGYHIHFLTPDFEELLSWYIDIFDLEIRPRGRIQTTTNVPGMNLSFATADEPTAPTLGRAIDHIGFELDDLEAFCEILTDKGVEFDTAYREINSIGLNVAMITDPSGVRIELTEGFDSY